MIAEHRLGKYIRKMCEFCFEIFLPDEQTVEICIVHITEYAIHTRTHTCANNEMREKRLSCST